ncbi:Peroxisomal membrane protein [Fulvia fulva]|uniref:Peroxisomal membrane protein n=1 Tax=Passalora fulva TaxID=5499 RepID=A0A9Q8L8B5_PASFU|nr:Peroxisomal membrane protein [Fulvia fulva]KAK4634413.1 Peroxisomal membrane protein [Fulvia fulva]KAK4636663.1 Peroxisomal membrane protein [Fulvia fulva]UJO12712.1 Peroxisomal membrane protein [Fulvia fulva]WPV08191.1 Peroxisomal membrane protein [Fulvia fulva]WPV24527.1 Peroxisomal membrane protein [Fulvia fulva]
MVADALIYHPEVAHFNRFVATTVGRDKLLRTVQYASRFLAWYLYRTNHPASTVAIPETIKKQFSSVRKAIRIGKFIEHLKAAAIASDSKSLDPVLKYLAVGRQLGYAVYLSLDTLCYIDQTGIYKLKQGARLQREAYRAWFVGLVCNIAASGYTLWNMREVTRTQGASGDAEKVVGQKRLQKERGAAQLQLLSDLCDITIPSNAIYGRFDDGIVGIAGTISSLIGLQAAWGKTA